MRFGLIALALGITACAPVPHTVVWSPPVTGKVHRDGQPVANATVYYEWSVAGWGKPVQDRCAFQAHPPGFRPVQTKHQNPATTGSDGTFHFAGVEAFEGMTLFCCQWNWLEWQVCIADGDARYQGWYERVWGIYPQDKEWGRYPHDLRLDCDLKAAPHEAERGRDWRTKGICRSSQF